MSGLFRTLAFVAGCTLSGLTGFIGMSLAVRGNVRTAAAALGGQMPPALKVAFRTGAVAGMFTVGFGLLGATVIVAIFQNTSTAILIGFGFGGSLLALFLRVGGGIFTKAADVGADLVGKVEAGIPEDDPRNPATIADNVGDNVGDCAGMAADLFESYEVTLVASIILGVSAFASIYPDQPSKWAIGLVFPIAAQAIGILGSMIGIFSVKGRDKDTTAMQPITRGLIVASVVTLIGIFALAMRLRRQRRGHDLDAGLRMFGAIVIGVVLAQVASKITEYFTSTETKPGPRHRQGGPHRPRHHGAVGHQLGHGVGGLRHHRHRLRPRRGHRPRRRRHPLRLLPGGPHRHGHALPPPASSSPRTPSARWPTTRRASPRCRASSPVRPRRSWSASTPWATPPRPSPRASPSARRSSPRSPCSPRSPRPSATRCSACSASPSSRPPARPSSTASTLRRPQRLRGLPGQRRRPEDLHRPAHRRLDRLHVLVARHPRRQPHGRWSWCRRCASSSARSPGSWTTPRSPTTARSSTSAPRPRSASWPRRRCIAILTPVIVGFGLGYVALGAFLAAVILTGQLMANFLSNSGGAWDNAKKYIEDGNEGGKGSDAHKAAVIGDTVGDPFKDTAGPALNPLIKVMNLVALLILPAIITTGDNTGLRLGVAGAALVVVVGAIVWSKKETLSMEDLESDAAAPGPRRRLIDPTGSAGHLLCPDPGPRGRDPARPRLASVGRGSAGRTRQRGDPPAGPTDASRRRGFDFSAPVD